MKSEINEDFYCSADAFVENEKCWICYDPVLPNKGKACIDGDCFAKKRKHPTPEQFEQEYGFKYPDDAPVWFKYNDDDEYDDCWNLCKYHFAKEVSIQKEIATHRLYYPKIIIVCACTPHGKPDDKWRPL